MDSPSTAVAGPVWLGSAMVVCTGRSRGDLGTATADGVAERRQRVYPGPWAWLDQVHGAEVHVVGGAGAVQGAPGDALVTAGAGVALAVFTADCAPVALASPEGVVGVAHAGWRGLEAGVVGAAIATMRRLGATSVDAFVGPCIHPCCYEFGERDLDALRDVLGARVVSRTASGRPALDLVAAVAIASEAAGARLAGEHGGCTACGQGWFSHRARRDRERQATVVVVPA